MLYSEDNTKQRVIWWDYIDKGLQQTSVLLTHLLIHEDLSAIDLLEFERPKIVTVKTGLYIAVEGPTRGHNQIPQSGSQNWQLMVFNASAY